MCVRRQKLVMLDLQCVLPTEPLELVAVDFFGPLLSKGGLKDILFSWISLPD